MQAATPSLVLTKLQSERAYTLLELLLVLAIGAVLLVFAVPALQNTLHQARLASSVASWQSDYYFAKSEAITRGEVLQLCPSRSGQDCDSTARDYSGGWIVKVVSTGAVLRDHALDPNAGSKLRISSNVAGAQRFLRFSPDGLAPSAGAFQTITFAANGYKTCLTLASSGRVREGACSD